MKSEVLVFLDIDGVLLPFGENVPVVPAGALFPDECLHALSELLRISNGEVVLSSTWRAQPRFVEDIVNDFHRYAAVHPDSPLGHIHSFPRMTSLHHFGVRQHEIAEFLDNCMSTPAAWIALDDEPLLEGKECEARRPHFEGHCVQTMSDEGLTSKQALFGVALIKEQLERHTSTSSVRERERDHQQPKRTRSGVARTTAK